MSWRCVPLPISFRLSSRSSAKMSLRSSSMANPSGAGTAAGDGGEHGIDDGFIAGAAAVIPRDRLDDVGTARRRVAVEQSFGGHQHPRRAVAALGGKILCKSPLQGMQLGSVLD